MKKIFIAAGQSLLATLLLLLVLEGIFTLLKFPTGASRYIESILIREQVPLRKSKDEFRIFTYGESTMHGSHYWPVSNPARWLAVYLHDFLPDKKIRVVNFSRMGHESSFTFRAFRDTVAYQPDLVVFYMGHNELLPGNLTYELEAKQKRLRCRIDQAIRRSRFLSAVYREAIRTSIRFKHPGAEDSIEYKIIETAPPEFTPDKLIVRGSPLYYQNMEYFKKQLGEILDTAERHRISVLFLKPVGNLKDFAPYVSSHAKSLPAEALSQWESFYEEGKKAQAKADGDAAGHSFQMAYAIDPTYADLSFRLGQIYFKRGELEKARRFFEEARDNDRYIVRATRDIHKIYAEFQHTRNLQLIDTEKILVPEIPGGILGEPIVEDNVHFSIKGHSLLGRALAQEIARRNWIAPKEEWKFERERPYEEIAHQLGVNPDLMFSADLKMIFYFGRHFENRLRYANKALALYPNDPRALRHLAWTYWVMGEKEKALAVYRKLQQLDPQNLQSVFENRPEIKSAFTSK